MTKFWEGEGGRTNAIKTNHCVAICVAILANLRQLCHRNKLAEAVKETEQSGEDLTTEKEIREERKQVQIEAA